MVSNEKDSKTTGLQGDESSLYKTLSDQQHYIDSVHETTIGLIQHINVDDLLEKILTKAGVLAGTPDRFLYLYDSHGDELIMKLGQGVYAEFQDTRIKPDKGLGGKVYTTGKPILIDDYSAWSNRIQHPLYDKLHSVLGIPLKSNTLTIGVIGLGSFESAKPFGANDLQKMSRFAELASIALENTRLNTDLQKELNERKLAEKELSNLRNFLSNIINSMPSVLVGVDVHGKVTHWNKAAEQTTGIPANKAYGKILSDVFPQMTSKMGKIRESIQTQESKHEQKRSYSSTRKTRHEEITIFPLIGNNDEGAVIRVDDVTDKVRLEEMMVQSEKMVSIGGLAVGMAHEINNPLAGMMQNAQVAHNRLTMNIPANDILAEKLGTSMVVINEFMEKRGILTQLESINKTGLRTSKIINNMLSFARKSDSKRREIDLKILIDDTIELIKNDYDLKKKYDFNQVEIIKEFNNKTPKIFCEGSKIQQVLFNIIKNASEAMSSQSKKQKLTLRLFKIQNKVCIEIEDNGPGMNEKISKRIFEPFFTTKSADKGTGIGLSLSYFIIVDDHGGEMEVDSVLGKGTKFIIKLPFRSKNLQR